MAVKDFMTRKVVYVSPDTTVAHTADMMREQGLRRLPVIENDRLVGIVTERTMAEASPSKATSLSIYEMNYLLNKTKIRDIMIRDVTTVSPYASLEDAVDTISADNLNIKRTIVATRKSGKVVIEIQIDGKADVTDLREKLINQGIQVDAIELTSAKVID